MFLALIRCAIIVRVTVAGIDMDHRFDICRINFPSYTVELFEIILSNAASHAYKLCYFHDTFVKSNHLFMVSQLQPLKHLANNLSLVLSFCLFTPTYCSIMLRKWWIILHLPGFCIQWRARIQEPSSERRASSSECSQPKPWFRNIVSLLDIVKRCHS